MQYLYAWHGFPKDMEDMEDVLMEKIPLLLLSRVNKTCRIKIGLERWRKGSI